MDREIKNAGHPVNEGRCSDCGHDGFVIGEGRNVRGQPIYPFVCRKCGLVSDQYAKRKDALAYAARFGLRPMESSPNRRPTQAMTKPCEVCGATGATQEHHWAPWHLFGDEAERWPKSWLCQPCHTRWHQIVTPNMGSKP